MIKESCIRNRELCIMGSISHCLRFTLLTGWMAVNTSLYAQLPAFPGAEGFGSLATGGRGGDVYYVTNLDASGVGSFAYGVQNAPAEGRTILFKVSGHIRLPSGSGGGLTVSKSKITVAGQSAPGDGICFWNNTMNITGNDLVFRHIRWRYGYSAAGGDSVDVNGSQRIIFDHCDIMFSTDENISSFGTAPEHMTFQWSLNAWGLNPHSCGGLWKMHHATVHHSLWANNHTRNPKLIGCDVFDWVNNLTFGWDLGFNMAPESYGTGVVYRVNIRNSSFVHGGSTTSCIYGGGTNVEGNVLFRLHMADTALDGNNNGVLDVSKTDYQLVSSGVLYGKEVNAWPQTTNGVTGAPTVGVPVSVVPRLTAYKKILSQAGATRMEIHSRPLRDEITALCVSRAAALQRGIISNPLELNLSTGTSFASLQSAAAQADTDGDGMPDDWESVVGYNPAIADHNTVLSSGELSASYFPSGSPVGYTRLEEYLHFLAVPHGTVAKNTVDSPSYIDVDLRRYTSGFTSSPVFSVFGVTGGTVSASGPGGAVVRFTPTQETSGRAGFLFTVTDADGDTWTQQCCLLVSLQPQPRPLTWVGDGVSNLWNFSATNFASMVGPVAFTNGDAVTIDDSGFSVPSITVSGALEPASLTVSNSAKAFMLTGSGSLGGSCGLTKLGSGTLTLRVNHAGTGSGMIDGGSVVLGGASNVGSLPSGTLVLQKGSVISNAWPSSASTLNITAPLVIPDGETATVFTGRRIQLSGAVTGSGALTLMHQGTDGTVQFRGAMNAFAGVLNLIFLGSNGALTTVFNGGSFNGWGAATVNLGGGILVNPYTNSGGNNFPIGALSGSGTLGGGSAGAPVYQIGGLNTDMLFQGAFAGNAKVTKVGTGVLTLTGTSTHTNVTTVSTGTMDMQGTFGISPVSVASNATLSGSGVFGGPVSVAPGGILAPGGAGGTDRGRLTAAALNLTSSRLRFDLTADPAGSNDCLAVTGGGPIVLTGNQTFDFTFTDGLPGSGTYDLITSAGQLFTTNLILSSNLPSGTRQSLTLEHSATNTTPSAVRLVVSGSAGNLTWTGTNSPCWDVQKTAAWRGASPGTFFTLDSVCFDDTSSTGMVAIVEAVSPRTVVVSNTSARAYTLLGGPLTGSTALIKRGSGALTLFLPQVTLATAITSNSVTATVASTNGLYRGMSVLGTGIPAGTTVSNILNATTLTLSTAALATSASASLTYETHNSYSGGTFLEGGSLVLDSNSTRTTLPSGPANPYGLGTGTITFRGGSLILHGHTNTLSVLYGPLPNDLVVPAGQTGTLASTPRGDSLVPFPALTGTLTGSGTLNLIVNYYRAAIAGDWSAFAGTLNVKRPATGASDPRFQLAGETGLPLATVNMEQVRLDYTAVPPQDGAHVPIGSLSGLATSVISGGQSSTEPVIWQVGGLGQNTTFAGAFTPYSGGGPIGLEKIGGGTWMLTGSGTVDAGITVEEGTLSYGDESTDWIGGAGGISVNTGAQLLLNSGATIRGAGCDVLDGGLLRGRGTLGSPLSCSGTFAVTGGTFSVQGSAYLGGVTRFSAWTDRIEIAGDLSLEGSMELPQGGLSYGRKVLMTYTGGLTLGRVQCGTLPSGYLALLDTTIAGEIAVRVEDLAAYQVWQVAHFGNTTDPLGAPDTDPDGDGMINFEEYEAGTDPQSAASCVPLVWSGGGSNRWDQAMTANWLENATRRVFRDGRPVVFNDAGTNQPAIDLRSGLRPGSVLVTNVSKAFSFAGEGWLEGPMSLTKGGAGTLSLLTLNSYTGLTTVVAGVLNIQRDTALGNGAGGTIVSNNARLELQGDIIVTGESLSIAGPGGSSFYNGALNSKSGTNSWNGPVTIVASNTRIGAQAGAVLKVTGVISSGTNTYGLIVRPADTTASVILAGANTYLGDTAVVGGPLLLSGGDDRLPISTILKMGLSSVSGRFDLNGCNQCLTGIALVSGTANVVTNSGVSEAVLTISNAVVSTNAVPLGGNLALTKAGTGMLSLTTRSSYSGSTRVDGGTVHLNFGSLSTPSNLLSATSSLILNGGLFRVTGKSGVATFQAMSGLTVLPGTSNTIEVVSLANEAVQLALGDSWSVGTGATLLLDISSSSNASIRASPPMTGPYLTGVLVKDTTGIGPAMVKNGYVVRHQPTTLAKDSNHAQTVFSSRDTQYTAGTLLWNNDGALTNRSVYELVLDTANSGGVIDMGSTNSVLTLTSGTVSFAGTNDLLLTHGQVGITSSTVKMDTSGSGVLTVAARVSGGTGYLVVSGSGLLQLTATNTYSGGTLLNAGTGTVIAAHASALGSGPVSVGSNATVQLNAPGATTYANAIAGEGYLRLLLSGVATGNTYVNSLAGFTGDIRLANGGVTGNKWNINNLGTLGAGLLIDSGSQLFVGGGTTAFSKGIMVSGTGNSENRGAIRLVGALGGTLTLLGSTTIGTEGGSLSGAIQGAVGGPLTLTFGTSSSTGNATVSQCIADGAGIVNVMKVAAGTLTLSATNRYSGGTTLSGGTLIVGNGATAGTGFVTVGTGATCTLQNPEGGIDDAADVSISGSGKLNVASGVTEVIRRLTINGAIQTAGVWNAARDAVHFAGLGQIYVREGVPDAPTGVVATAGMAEIGLRWASVSNATAYSVRRSTVSGSGYQQVATLSTTNWNDVNVLEGTNYYYVVAASNALGTGPDSMQVAAQPLPLETDGVWTNTVSGVWGNKSNWLNQVYARGVGRRATIAPSVAVTVTQSLSSCTIGELIFTNANHALASGVLTLDAASAVPQVCVATAQFATVSTVLTGTNGLLKTGHGTLILSGANTYTGLTTIANGTVVAQANAALGTIVFGTEVQAGATLDLGGALASGGLNLGTEELLISGAGVNGQGVLVNRGSNDQINAVQKFTLQADASVGGTRRWDVRGSGNRLDMNGHVLTKTGTNTVALVGTTMVDPGHIDVAQGIFGLHTSGNLAGTSANTMTVRASASLDFYQNTGSKPWTLVLADGAVTTSSGGSSWNGPVTLAGTNGGSFTIGSGHTFTCSGIIGEATSGRSLVKSGAGTLTLSASNTYSGITRISAGTLKITTSAALPQASAVILEGGILDLAGASSIASPAKVASLTGNGGALRLSTTDRLVITGNLSGTLVLAISDPQNLAEGTTYTVATYGGTPPGTVSLQNVALPWMANWTGGAVRVFKAKGTILSVH